VLVGREVAPEEQSQDDAPPTQEVPKGEKT